MSAVPTLICTKFSGIADSPVLDIMQLCGLPKRTCEIMSFHEVYLAEQLIAMSTVCCHCSKHIVFFQLKTFIPFVTHQYLSLGTNFGAFLIYSLMSAHFLFEENG